MNISTIFFYFGATATLLYFNKYYLITIINKNNLLLTGKSKVFTSKETQTEIFSLINDPSLNKACQINDTIFLEDNIEKDIEIINNHPYKYLWFNSFLL